MISELFQKWPENSLPALKPKNVPGYQITIEPNSYQTTMHTIDPPKSQGRSTLKSALRSPFFDIFQFITLIAGICWLTIRSVENIGYNWQWYQIPKYLFLVSEKGIAAGPLVEGLKLTLFISLFSLVFALFIGLITALLRLSNSPVTRGVATLYLEISRNTPLLIQIFFIYFVLGPVLGLGRIPSAILALSLFEGAYAAEIFRSGILSVARGQHEAAHSIGLKPFDRYRHIILPQAVRTVLPPLTSQAISLGKRLGPCLYNSYLRSYNAGPDGHRGNISHL